MLSSFWTSKTPSEVFPLIASADAMEQFQGLWPVPGIESALPGGDIAVRDSWGFWNREKITACQEPYLLVFRIRPNPLLRLFVRSLQEEWRLQPELGGTRVWRNWEWDQRLPFPKKLFQRAILRNNRDLTRWIAYTEKPRRPLHTRR